VALRADFHLPLPRQRRRVPNLEGTIWEGTTSVVPLSLAPQLGIQPLRALLPVITRPLPFHMLSPCPMAPLARNPQYVPVFSVDILRRC
jgi:hypothetical protein